MAGKQQYSDHQLDVLKTVLTENPGFTIQEAAKELARPERWGLEVSAKKIDRVLRNERFALRFGLETKETILENLKKAYAAHRGYVPKREPLNLDRGFSSFARSLQISK